MVYTWLVHDFFVSSISTQIFTSNANISTTVLLSSSARGHLHTTLGILLKYNNQVSWYCVASWQKHNMLGSVYCSVNSFLAWRGVSGACQHGKVQDRLLAFQMPSSLLLVRRMCTASWCGAVLCLIQHAGLLPQYWVSVKTLANGIGKNHEYQGYQPTEGIPERFCSLSLSLSLSLYIYM